MMPDIEDTLLAVSRSLAASVVLKGTVFAALGILGARAAGRSRAAVRHALLAVAFAALIALPLASLAIPPIRVALQTAEAVPPPAAPAGAAASIEPSEASAEMPVEPAPSRLTPAVLLAAAWAAGAALFLIPVLVGLAQVRRLRRTALPWRQGQAIAQALAAEAGLHRCFEVLLHETLAGPMMCGALNPAIVLPVEARTWRDEDLKRALVHELAHVRRGDWAVHCLVRAVCAAYWFHPLVWIARRSLVLEAERACDDAVLARSEATEYADQLVGVAERIAAARTPLLAMASRADLTKRVGAVLDPRQRRGRAGRPAVALACAAAAALVLAVAPLQVVAAPEPVATGIMVAAPAPAPMTPAPQAPVAKARVLKPAEPVLVAAAPQAAPAPPTPPTAGAPMARFSAETMLVSLNVAASYPNGGSIAGLTPGDFAVTEDGVPQSIKVFEYQETGSASPSSYYVLGYYNSHTALDGQFRTIKVSLTGNTAAKVDYRMGYFARGGSAPVVSDAPGPGVTLPAIQHKVEPAYSEAARKAKFQGWVALLITVNADGTVGDIHVLRSLGLGLDEQAIKAVQMWKFIPGKKDLVPVPMEAQVDVSFRLM